MTSTKKLAGIRKKRKNNLRLSKTVNKSLALKTGSFCLLSLSFHYPGLFTFLNRSHNFGENIDWNFPGHKKLWTYNLNYFDYLLQPDLETDAGLKLIHQYLDDLAWIKDGLEPYPVSLRIMNWVKFCLQQKVNDPRINRAIHGHTKHLSKNLEYHLLGNHLLENAFALCFGGLYACDEKLLGKGKDLLLSELEEQLFADGGHFERSPMYHQILLGRLLDLINLIQAANLHPDLLQVLTSKARQMLGWMQAVSFYGKHLPLINDSAFGIAPTAEDLLAYGQRLGLEPAPVTLNDSGFRKFAGQNWELLADMGAVSPDYQPGHAHAGLFGFELYLNGKPCIVDTGTSTYDPGPRRETERSTPAHNTVSINQENSSEVWASHRVGRRARVKMLEDKPGLVKAQHDGYKRFGALVERSFAISENKLIIKDSVSDLKKQTKGQRSLGGQKELNAKAYLHFHPDINVHIISDSIIVDKELEISFQGANEIRLEGFEYAPMFNTLIESTVVLISFDQTLTTTIRVV